MHNFGDKIANSVNLKDLPPVKITNSKIAT